MEDKQQYKVLRNNIDGLSFIDIQRIANNCNKEIKTEFAFNEVKNSVKKILTNWIRKILQYCYYYKQKYVYADYVLFMVPSQLLNSKNKKETLIIPRKIVNLIVKELAQDYFIGVVFQPKALLLLHLALEAFIVCLFKNIREKIITKKNILLSFANINIRNYNISKKIKKIQCNFKDMIQNIVEKEFQFNIKEDSIIFLDNFFNRINQCLLWCIDSLKNNHNNITKLETAIRIVFPMNIASPIISFYYLNEKKYEKYIHMIKCKNEELKLEKNEDNLLKSLFEYICLEIIRDISETKTKNIKVKDILNIFWNDEDFLILAHEINFLKNP
jgi:histone H3/H4